MALGSADWFFLVKFYLNMALLICVVSIASCELQWQSWVTARETMQLAKPKIFANWPFTEKSVRTVDGGIPKQTYFTSCVYGDLGLCLFFITSNTILSHLSVNFIFQNILMIFNAILNGIHKCACGLFPSLNFSCEQSSPGLILVPDCPLTETHLSLLVNCSVKC